MKSGNDIEVLMVFDDMDFNLIGANRSKDNVIDSWKCEFDATSAPANDMQLKREKVLVVLIPPKKHSMEITAHSGQALEIIPWLHNRAQVACLTLHFIVCRTFSSPADRLNPRGRLLHKHSCPWRRGSL